MFWILAGIPTNLIINQVKTYLTAIPSF